MAIYKRPKRYNFCNETFDPSGECLKNWSKERDKTVRNDFRTFFNLGEDVSISINIIGNGLLRLDDTEIAPSQKYNWVVFKQHPLQISIECASNAMLASWSDGIKEHSRIIVPENNVEYTASCRQIQ